MIKTTFRSNRNEIFLISNKIKDKSKLLHFKSLTLF